MNGNVSNKNTGRWSEDECKRFEDAYFFYNNDMKKITRAVGTRTIVQVRSHAQKAIPKLEIKRKRMSQRQKTTPNLGIPQSNSPAYQAWLYHSLSASYMFQMMQMENIIKNRRNNETGNSQPDEEQKENPDQNDLNLQ